jgi:excisionase family DNA binding protein
VDQEHDEPTARPPQWLTVDEAAKALRISRSHLYAQIAAGHVAGVVKIGKVIRINLDVLLRSRGVAS